MKVILRFSALVLASLLAVFPSVAADKWPAEPPAEAPADWGPVSANFEEIDYPYPVHFLKLRRFDQDMNMAYMDIEPTGRSNGQTIFWQHGMNFYSEAYTPCLLYTSPSPRD